MENEIRNVLSPRDIEEGSKEAIESTMNTKADVSKGKSDEASNVSKKDLLEALTRIYNS